MKTTRFDPMEFLEGVEDHLELLNDALATGNPQVIVGALGEVARDRGMAELARMTGIGRSTLYKGLANDANPTIETVMQVLTALKLQLRAEPKSEAA